MGNVNIYNINNNYSRHDGVNDPQDITIDHHNLYVLDSFCVYHITK